MLLPLLISAYFLVSSHHSYSANFGALIMENDWFAWTILPYIFANVGFWFTSIGSYILTHICSSTGHITYGEKDRFSRWKEAKIAWTTQLPDAIKTTFIMQGLNVAIGRHFFRYFGTPPDRAFPGFEVFLMDFAGMFILFDFFNYWQHRAGHTFDIMWRSHKVHHEVQTPISLSSARIGFFDEMGAAGVVYLAAFIVQPHPLAYSFAVAGILSDIAAVHSGLNSGLFDVMTLRFLPGRADVRLHDQHHMYSDYKGGKNFGQFFWVWDYAFGTLSTYSENMK